MGALSNRISLMQKDHRASKQQMEREKNELTQQVFQSQSLLTTVQGKSIKQEKEMAKLQVRHSLRPKHGRRQNNSPNSSTLLNDPYPSSGTPAESDARCVT